MRGRSEAIFEDAKHVLNFMRLEAAQCVRERRHAQGSATSIEPQIAHSYARAGVKIKERLKELAESIRSKGVLSPLVVAAREWTF